MSFTELECAKTVQWLLCELFFLAVDGSVAESIFLTASNRQDLRVLALEQGV